MVTALVVQQIIKQVFAGKPECGISGNYCGKITIENLLNKI